MKKEKMSLLETAKSYQLHRKRKKTTSEDIEIALAWIRGEITLTQINYAYGTPNNKGGNNLYKIATAIKEAYEQGKIIIK